MQVSKWGNSLAIRLPTSIIKDLELSEGDEAEVFVVDERAFELRKKPGKEALLNRLRKFRGKLPDDFKFERDEANDRF